MYPRRERFPTEFKEDLTHAFEIIQSNINGMKGTKCFLWILHYPSSKTQQGVNKGKKFIDKFTLAAKK
jgi:hypothetical protein